MKIAVRACLTAEGDVDVDAGHYMSIGYRVSSIRYQVSGNSLTSGLTPNAKRQTPNSKLKTQNLLSLIQHDTKRRSLVQLGIFNEYLSIVVFFDDSFA